MLERIDFSSPKTPKDDYKERHREMLARLLALQQKARAAGLGVVVLFEGWDGAGKGSRISDLLYRLDARFTSVSAAPAFALDEQLAFREAYPRTTGYFPDMQPFWQGLGRRGDMTIYERGWLTSALRAQLVDGRSLVRSVLDFESQLVADGYVVVKFFLHISQKTQVERLSALARDPATSWRVRPEELARTADYDKLLGVYDALLEATDAPSRHWHVLNGEDKRGANLAIAQVLIDEIEAALARGEDPAVEAARKAAEANAAKSAAALGSEREDGGRTGEVSGGAEPADPAFAPEMVALAAAQHAAAPKRADVRFPLLPDPPRTEDVAHDLVLPREEYKLRLKAAQKRLFDLELGLYRARRPLILVYEGWDAAGKGGNIKRVCQALDARAYTIFTSAAPGEEERMHPHLWRYWTRLPKAGHVGIYDRSWYGRVLVERVEGFSDAATWARAYDEICSFEADLDRWGAIVMKFWVDVSREEQLARFESRAADPARRWKITDEDWRNRDKYLPYAAAVDDMFALTSTTYAPWIVLEGDDKSYARVKALELINERLDAELSD